VAIKSSNGIRFRIAGVVTTFDGGHPEGSNEVYEGLAFSDPFEAANTAFAAAKRGEVRLLLSHMGDDKDMEYAAQSNNCDIVIGGHTHVVLDTVINNIVVAQTGRKLKHVGVTTLRMKGRKIISADYRNIPLSGYAKDSATLALVEAIEDNPQLKIKVGEFAEAVTHIGFADLLTKSLAEGMNTQALGQYSHTEGSDTVAKGNNSHAEGKGTKATVDNQHVEGIYNAEESTAYHIIGCGTSNTARANCFTAGFDPDMNQSYIKIGTV
jgi:hypothetical protein